MSKVLFVSYDGLTDPLGQSQILPYMTGLAAKGHEIHILSCEKIQNYNLQKEVIAKKCKAAKIHWHHVNYRDKYPVISPYGNTKRLKRKLGQLHQEFKYDIFHCRSIIPTLCAYPYQSEFTKLIFDIRGFWADERVEGKIWNLRIPIYRYLYHHFKRKEKQLFEKSDAIVTLTNNAKNYIDQNFNTKKNFGVVPCTVDLNHFDINAVDSQKRNDLGFNESDVVFCYSGSLGTRYLTKEVLECFSKIKHSIKHAKLLILTKSDTSELKHLLSFYKVEDVATINSCSYQEIPSYIAACNVAIYFIYEGFSGKAVSPTKQAEFLSLGKPVITNNGIGDTFELISKQNVGLVLNDLNEQEFIKVGEQVSELLKISPEHCINVANKYFNLDSGIETYNSLYQKLSQKK